MKRPQMKLFEGLETIWFENADQDAHVEVYPFKPGQPNWGTIHVYRHREFDYIKNRTYLEKAVVNWGAFGVVTIETALQYAKGIEVACKVAEELDKELLKVTA